MKVDSHMHTHLCGHAAGEPIEYVARAAAVGIDLVTFTCHIPMSGTGFGQEGIRMRPEEMKRYRALIAQTAEEAKQLGVEVLCGIEAEVYPDETELVLMDSILQAQDFDFVLGSLHAQCSGYQDWLRLRKIKDDATRIDTYFRHLRDGVLSGRYDSMAHPDVIRTYGVVRRFDPAEHEGVIREFLVALVEEDCCMEVNTSGLTKGDFEVHPDPLILRWAAEMGVRLTIGSDAHRPAAVGQFFELIQPMLFSMGFTELHYFRRRQRQAIPMPHATVP